MLGIIRIRCVIYVLARKCISNNVLMSGRVSEFGTVFFDEMHADKVNIKDC